MLFYRSRAEEKTCRDLSGVESKGKERTYLSFSRGQSTELLSYFAGVENWSRRSVFLDEAFHTDRANEVTDLSAWRGLEMTGRRRYKKATGVVPPQLLAFRAFYSFLLIIWKEGYRWQSPQLH